MQNIAIHKKIFTFSFSFVRKKVQVESLLSHESSSNTYIIFTVIFHYIHYKVWRLSKSHLSYIMIGRRLDKMFIKPVEEKAHRPNGQE